MVALGVPCSETLGQQAPPIYLSSQNTDASRGLFGNPSFNVSKRPRIIRRPRKDSNTRETKTTEKEI